MEGDYETPQCGVPAWTSPAAAGSRRIYEYRPGPRPSPPGDGLEPEPGALGAPAVSAPAPMSVSSADADLAGRHRQRLLDLQNALRDDLAKSEDDQLKALFETTAEALGGLANAFDDYVEADEGAWEGGD